jgi:hypothetical protein
VEPLEGIVNRRALVERFGCWPSFHDAEVVAVRLDSGQRSQRPPSAELDIHVFEMTSETDEDGFFILRLHTLVTLRFDGLIEIELDGFGSQNSLDSLELGGSPGGDDGFVVELPANVGLGGALRCQAATVLSVEPFEPGPRSIGGPRGPCTRLALVKPTAAGAPWVLYSNAEGIRELVATLRGPLELGQLIRFRRPPGKDSGEFGWMLLREVEGPVQIATADRELRIWGAKEHLGMLADDLEARLEHNDFDDPDTHTHVDQEWSPAPPWLAADALPLMIAAWPAPESKD